MDDKLKNRYTGLKNKIKSKSIIQFIVVVFISLYAPHSPPPDTHICLPCLPSPDHHSPPRTRRLRRRRRRRQVWWVSGFQCCSVVNHTLSKWRPGLFIILHQTRRPWLSNVTAEGRSNLNGSVLTWRASVSEQREEDYDANEGGRCVCPSPRDSHRELNSLESVGLLYLQMSCEMFSPAWRELPVKMLVNTFHTLQTAETANSHRKTCQSVRCWTVVRTMPTSRC